MQANLIAHGPNRSVTVFSIFPFSAQSYEPYFVSLSPAMFWNQLVPFHPGKSTPDQVPNVMRCALSADTGDCGGLEVAEAYETVKSKPTSY
jgi:hypothetical protein